MDLPQLLSIRNVTTFLILWRLWELSLVTRLLVLPSIPGMLLQVVTLWMIMERIPFCSRWIWKKSMFQSMRTIWFNVTQDMDLFSVMDMISTLPISVTQMQTAMQISHMLITSRMNLSMLKTSKPIG